MFFNLSKFHWSSIEMIKHFRSHSSMFVLKVFALFVDYFAQRFKSLWTPKIYQNTAYAHLQTLNFCGDYTESTWLFNVIYV